MFNVWLTTEVIKAVESLFLDNEDCGSSAVVASRPTTSSAELRVQSNYTLSTVYDYRKTKGSERSHYKQSDDYNNSISNSSSKHYNIVIIDHEPP